MVNLPRLIPHRFGNVGNKPARALFTVISGTNFERFFEELSTLPRDEPPDMAKVEEIAKRYGIEVEMRSTNTTLTHTTIEGLASNSTYYVNVYAVNFMGLSTKGILKKTGTTKASKYVISGK